jgi:putative endonuclease
MLLPNPVILRSVTAKPGRVSKDARSMGAYLYILLCADGSCYVGTTIGSLERRLAEHEAGTYDGYTARRQPVRLVFSQHFERLEDAAVAERQIKGWRREKKEALIRGDYASLPVLARRGSGKRTDPH